MGNHPETPARLALLLEGFPGWSEGRPATKEEVLLCHTREHVERVLAIREPTWFDADTPASETTPEAALLAAGTCIEAARSGAFAFGRTRRHRPGRHRRKRHRLGAAG